jgi:hypothetical protein
MNHRNRGAVAMMAIGTVYSWSIFAPNLCWSLSGGI